VQRSSFWQHNTRERVWKSQEVTSRSSDGDDFEFLPLTRAKSSQNKAALGLQVEGAELVHVDSKSGAFDLLAKSILQQKEMLEPCLFGIGHEVSHHEVGEDIGAVTFEADEGVSTGKDWPMLFEKALSIVGVPLGPSGDGPLGGEASHVKNCEEGGSLVWSSLHAVVGDLVGLKELAVAGAIQEELGLVARVEKRELLVHIDHERSEDQVSLGILPPWFWSQCQAQPEGRNGQAGGWCEPQCASWQA